MVTDSIYDTELGHQARIRRNDPREGQKMVKIAMIIYRLVHYYRDIVMNSKYAPSDPFWVYSELFCRKMIRVIKQLISFLICLSSMLQTVTQRNGILF